MPGDRYAGTLNFTDLRTMEIYDEPDSRRGLGVELEDFQVIDVEGTPWFYVNNRGWSINAGAGTFGPLPSVLEGSHRTGELEWATMRVITFPGEACGVGIALFGDGGTIIEDLDGDGALDMVATAPGLWPRNGYLYGGGVYVIDDIESELAQWTSDPDPDIYGRHNCGDGDVMDAQALSSASFRAEEEYTFLGYDIASVGDVDGDGVRDVLVHEGNTDQDLYTGCCSHPFDDRYCVLSGRVLL